MREEGYPSESYSRNLLRFFVPMLLLVQLTGYFGNLFWAFDLFAHAQAQFFAAGLLLLVLAVFARLLPFAGLCMLSLGMSASALLPLYVRALPVTVPEQTLRVLTLNVLTKNTSYERVGSYVKAASPDVLLLLEVNAEWVRNLGPALGELPHRFLHPRDDNFGLALFSRFPLDAPEVKAFGGSPTPTLVAKIRAPQGTVRFFGIHTLPPATGGASKLRDQLFTALFDESKRVNEPMIVSGDFNSSRWGYPLRSLLRSGALSDSGDGFGFRPTWFGGGQPDWLIAAGIFGVPVDTLLHSKHFLTIERKIGPPVGSDHLGVEVTLGWLPG